MLELLRREIVDSRVVAAMAQVPREKFVPEAVRAHAYDDRALPIGEDQTISQPLIVGLMTEALDLDGSEKVLEVGTGSGYQAAVLSLLAGEVISVERLAGLRQQAEEALKAGGYPVKVRSADAAVGRPDEAPYDAIIVTAAASTVPDALLDQLAVGGLLVIPVGTRSQQDLIRIRKYAMGTTRENLGPCGFVPLIGEGGFPD
ncbi:MAG: protein-L-isoaspartate(D-aspartate) O-methyltransferase [Dehalococcoidia bacterium]|nr:protein-L-isoaspartate(D-aspartate) O-methyltransferase [Dehalococcoidia bacterium]